MLFVAIYIGRSGIECPFQNVPTILFLQLSISLDYFSSPITSSMSVWFRIGSCNTARLVETYHRRPSEVSNHLVRNPNLVWLFSTGKTPAKNWATCSCPTCLARSTRSPQIFRRDQTPLEHFRFLKEVVVHRFSGGPEVPQRKMNIACVPCRRKWCPQHPLHSPVTNLQ